MEDNSANPDAPSAQDAVDDVPSSGDDFEPADTARIFALGVGFEGGLAVIACAVGWLCDFSPLQTFTWRVEAIVWGLGGTLPLLVGLVAIDRFPQGPFRELKQVVDDLILPLFRGFRIWQFAVLALSAGIGEEFLFRGLIQGALSGVLGTQFPSIPATWIALAVASLLFGLMHPITRTYAIVCVLVGLYLGGLWIYTGNLLVSIVIHAAYDFVALVFLTRAARKIAPRPS